MSAPISGFSAGRCLASDLLGNRCHKDSNHTGAAESTSRRHDASRGDLQRLWV